MDPGELPRSLIFIDFEHWFWGLWNLHKERPDIQWLIREVKKRGKLEQIYCFGDFTKSEEIAQEKDELRLVTSNIIDCSNNSGTIKDYTDFIMLDQIYQAVLKSPEIEQYIIVTGDNHFHSVVAYLTNFLDKKVGIFGVQDSFSAQLKRCATWYVEIKPKTNQELCMQLILTSLQYAHDKDILATFSGTTDIIVRNSGVDRKKIIEAFDFLLKNNYVERILTEEKGYPVTKLVTDWEKLRINKLWDYENPPKINISSPFACLIN